MIETLLNADSVRFGVMQGLDHPQSLLNPLFVKKSQWDFTEKLKKYHLT